MALATFLLSQSNPHQKGQYHSLCWCFHVLCIIWKGRRHLQQCEETASLVIVWWHSEGPGSLKTCLNCYLPSPKSYPTKQFCASTPVWVDFLLSVIQSFLADETGLWHCAAPKSKLYAWLRKEVLIYRLTEVREFLLLHYLNEKCRPRDGKQLTPWHTATRNPNSNACPCFTKLLKPWLVSHCQCQRRWKADGICEHEKNERKSRCSHSLQILWEIQ